MHNETPEKMNPFDSALIQTALSWLPYGGADADVISAEFGFSPVQYSQNVLQALDRWHLPNLSDTTKAELRRVAQSTVRAK